MSSFDITNPKHVPEHVALKATSKTPLHIVYKIQQAKGRPDNAIELGVQHECMRDSTDLPWVPVYTHPSLSIAYTKWADIREALRKL